VPEGNEECDDGNTVDGDGCPATCTYPAFVCASGSEIPGLWACNGDDDCGDGSDEYPANAACPEPVCGDGITNGDLGEECDDGDQNGSEFSFCEVDCRYTRFVCASGEQVLVFDTCNGYANCVDGSDEYPANADCPVPFCGDNITNYDLGEVCDDGDFNGLYDCDVDCTYKTFFCADGTEVYWQAGCNGYPDCFDGSDEYPLNAACPAPFCGDFITTPDIGEECDEGDFNGQPGGYCDADCLYNRFTCQSGDEVLAWETCNGYADCFDGSDEYPLNADCPVPFCGDYVTNYDLGEECDYGAENGLYDCDVDCTYKTFLCADGTEVYLQAGCNGYPDCLDGSDEYPLNADCPVPFCGDYITNYDLGEECDYGAENGLYECDIDCRYKRFTCLTGDQVYAWDACNGYANCFDGSDEYPLNPACPAPICGNGNLEFGEECDDGNPFDGDGCSAGCVIEGPTECIHDQCVAGGPLDPGLCGPCVAQVCAVDSYCCTTAWDDICVGEVASICGETCGAPEVCGNGVLEPSEECDDGNLVDGDGCSSACIIETPPQCAHDQCVAGAALDFAQCTPCVTQICAVDPYCCTTAWDSVCVGEVESICGEVCN
jgi:cysteine-rich repeat protein